MIGIYLIEINNYKYVGQSTNIVKRLRGHIVTLKNNRHDNKKMQDAYNHYQNIKTTILETCDISRLDEQEAFWMNEYTTFKTKYGLNFNIAGKNPPILRGKDSPNYGKKRPYLSLRNKLQKRKPSEEEKALKSKYSISFDKDKLVLISPEGEEVHLKDYCSVNEFSKQHNLCSGKVIYLLKGMDWRNRRCLSLKNWTVKGRD